MADMATGMVTWVGGEVGVWMGMNVHVGRGVGVSVSVSVSGGSVGGLMGYVEMQVDKCECYAAMTTFIPSVFCYVETGVIHSGISQGKRKSEERNNESGSMGLWAMDMDMAK
ncbi:uncharacterized protein SETTUDRAFT_40020 [Exserohilum turcica Et28A]|uniref:Uncharacterized protein n=1 Tax=Exserohilum turcicum (strain 28A) TaxID=671987 RepID=R0ILR6_EXST2|nr:uncharacterized protein SETTUDRAFT_40020 [Exserohilum turcica Et28A]EOA85761.1 hypothetical protein SETTUDRAFT_40020 [Exserohilum turcica Et28A]